MVFPGGSDGKESVCHAGDPGLIPGSGRSLTLPGEFHGQRSPVGYSPRGRKESDMTERLHFHFQGDFSNPVKIFHQETLVWHVQVYVGPERQPCSCRAEIILH